MRFLTLSAVVFTFLLSCSKENNDYDMQQFWEYHQSLGLDSSAVNARLAGSWKWKSQVCTTGGYEEADKNVVATFASDGSYQVTENGLVIDQGHWKIASYGSGGWRLEFIDLGQVIHPPYFFGEMMFCGNRIMFVSRPVDGCDFLFEKQ
jgi:hypothetical protein